jgi:hypothetical protein
MPHYVRGTIDGNGYYSGVAVSSAIQLLNAIKAGFETAGWTTLLDDITNSQELNVRGVDNGDFCYLNFSIQSGAGANDSLIVIGDKDGLGASFGGTKAIPFAKNGTGRLFMTADASALDLCIFNPETTTASIHGGYLSDRLGQKAFEWMLGYLDIWLTNAFHAESAFGTTWMENRLFYYPGVESQTNPRGGYNFLWDSQSLAINSSSYSSVSSTAFGYSPWLGNVDAVTGQPNLGTYGYLEALAANHSSYVVDISRATALHNPGKVKFAVTGLSSKPAGYQFRPANSTTTYLSAGGEGWQGFKIAD